MIVGVILSCSTSIGAHAALKVPPEDQMAKTVFSILDHNKDGILTKDESPEVAHWAVGMFEMRDLSSPKGHSIF